MIKENAVAGKHVVGFTVIYGNPIRVKLGSSIRALRVKWSGFTLGSRVFQTSKQFRCRCLVIAAIPAVDAKGLQKLQSGHTRSFRRILRDLKGNTHMGLGSQIVNLSGADFSNQAH